MVEEKARETGVEQGPVTGMAGPQGQPPWLGFNPLSPPAGGYPSLYPYAPPYYWGPQPSPAATEAAPSPQLATLKEELGQIANSVAEQMAALQQRLDQQEAERQRAEEERKRKEETDRLVNAHRAGMQQLEERHAAALKALEEKLAPQKAPQQDTEIAELRKELADLAKSLHDQEIAGLRQEIAELRKVEPSSPTEMGVIQHTADKVVEAARDAGSGLHDVITGLQRGAAFPAGRRTPQERAELGKELADRASKNITLIGEMDKFFATGGG